VILPVLDQVRVPIEALFAPVEGFRGPAVSAHALAVKARQTMIAMRTDKAVRMNRDGLLDRIDQPPGLLKQLSSPITVLTSLFLFSDFALFIVIVLIIHPRYCGSAVWQEVQVTVDVHWTGKPL
jgi:hypothetical protein